MKEVLAVIKHDNKEYVKKFNKIVDSAHLTTPQIEKYGNVIIGQVLDDYSGYKKALRLKKFLGTGTSEESIALDMVLLNAGNLSGKYSMGIGSIKNRLEIFQQENTIDKDSYVLARILYKMQSGKRISYDRKEEESKWVDVPEEFLAETYELLQFDVKPRFSILKRH